MTSREAPKDETLIHSRSHTLIYIIYQYSSDNDIDSRETPKNETLKTQGPRKYTY